MPKQSKSKLHDAINGRYDCSECGKRFSKPCLLRRHSSVHSNQKDYQCESCEKKFSQKSSLQRHNLHQHMGEKLHKCPKCKISFAQKTNLLVHIKRTHPLKKADTENRFACDNCSCVFTKLNSLNRHKTKNHQMSETEKLKIAFQDETPVDDATELANIVLLEMKKLQNDMQPPPKTQTTANQRTTNDEKIETPETNNKTIVVEKFETHMKQLVDKLDPWKKNKKIEVQCIKRDDGKMYYVCEYCAKEFRKSSDIIRHRRIHLNEKPYKCNHCSKSFYTKSKLTTHTKVHISSEHVDHVNNQYNCIICQQKFDSIRQLDVHNRTHLQTHNFVYVCSICFRTFKSLGSFSTHKHTEPDNDLQTITELLPEPINISVEKNDSKSIKTSQMLLHFQRHKKIYPNSELKFKCNICGRRYASKSSLNIHFKIHTAHCKQFTCETCVDKKFTTKSQLKRHMVIHNQIKNFKCVYCEKTFKTKENCKSHMKSHIRALLKTDNKNIMEEKNSNKSCQIIIEETRSNQPTTPKFIELQMLEKYRKCKQHNNIIVKAMPSAINSLQNTTDCVEKLEKNVCSICQRKFQKPNDLQRHLRTHTKERPFACSLCSKSFTLKSTLNEHLVTHSEKRSTYDCQVCGKHYASKRVLVVHLRLHTGERPFRCEHCEKKFRTSGHLKAHMHVAHKHINLNIS